MSESQIKAGEEGQWALSQLPQAWSRYLHVLIASQQVMLAKKKKFRICFLIGL